MTHILQTPAWGRFQSSLGREVVADAGDGWRYQAILEKGRMNSRLYAPYGPELESSAALPAALGSMVAQAKRLGAAFVRVEPTGLTAGSEPRDAATTRILEAAGLRPTSAVQPEQTWRVDLTRSEDEILGDMSKTGRNLYRNYAKKGLSVRSSDNPDDVEVLLTLLAGVAAQTGMKAHSDEYFRAQARALLPEGRGRLYFVDVEGDPVAASLVYDDEERRYYAHAAADYEHRRLHPGNILVTQMMLDARAEGKREFDFYGVAPAGDPEHPWAGFSTFKRSFGGYDHHFVGAWELPVRRGGYAVYSMLRRVLD
ncbi:peptidoglycan bridge formation peptidyltransferase VanK-Sc [Klugiella xanthotipulae]|uniref:Acetyltransferase (GNAT) family protein n=1 Tax=Klugiella xanthotipulae TaxID=244735 RepID=A0A543HXZ9_9MICO|nr:GNAT family N-acetyltransferase [Klugiella xanthotipulae]TQM63150.1 acetyltransferase (GNAT) family protein [Klugiella xanthotipulae]